jgi:Raf kinase inhibitor-like YbhB/YbcL family protein
MFRIRWESVMRMLAAVPAILFLSVPASAMTIASNDFRDGGVLPMVHVYPRCGGQNVSPELHWGGAPASAKSLVLTMIDGDVKPAGWSHWIVVDLPVASTGLAHGTSSLPAGATGVASNFGDASYDGPCPPKGTGTHHYVFTIWAMPMAGVSIVSNAKATEVEAMLARSAIAHASVTGTVTP